MNSQERPFLTIKEVSKLLGISVSTINRLIKKGDFSQNTNISQKDGIYEKANSRMDKVKVNKLLI